MECVASRASAAVAALTLALVAVAAGCSESRPHEMLHVSYDPTRELWSEINRHFIAHYAQTHSGEPIVIRQSHGGSSTQARSVMEGLPADIVSLALWPDIDAIRRTGLIHDGWEKDFPRRSLPFTSCVVFLVRKGNPKRIYSWQDLLRRDIEIVCANPKTSGGGKLCFLAAWGSAIVRGGTEEDARQLVRGIYGRIKSLDSGARGASTRFSENGRGDVLLTWENEAHLDLSHHPDEVEIVMPKATLLAEPHVAIVDENVRRHGTTELARAYLDYCYTPEAQELIAAAHYRPTDPAVLARHRADFPMPSETMFRLTDFVSGWDEAMQKFFQDHGEFDRIYESPDLASRK